LSVACNTPIEDDDELDRRMQMIDALFSYAATEDDIPAILAHMLSDQVYEYEQKNLVLPTVTPAKALAFFMSENSVKQKDLKHIATQSIISEILNSKRKMTVEHIKAFSAHFGVPETPFLG
jgi:HTH-type transcriptional regulator/antitoxin HigA